MQEKSTNSILSTSIDQLSSLIRSATILGEPVIISNTEAIEVDKILLVDFSCIINFSFNCRVTSNKFWNIYN